MSDTTNTAESGAGAVAPAQDAPQVTQGTDTQAELTPEQQQAQQAEQQRQEEEGKKKNRTREYIGKLQTDNADLRRRLADLEARSQPRTQHASPTPQHPAGDRRPTLEDHGYDFAAWQQADTQWVEQQAERRAAQLYDQRAQQAREQETWTTYETKVAEFANDHEDFYEVVGSIPPLPLPLQAAIAAHPNGPAIAYHLGTNPSDLLAYANTNPQFAGLALQHIAARVSAAPAASQEAPALAAPAPTKPITKAPPPAPTVGGRATAGPKDPDKMTTDEWRVWREAQIKANRG